MSGVGLAAAFAGGVVSFLSPCVLPHVPGYLGAIVGAPDEDERGGVPALARIAGRTGLFVGGFLTQISGVVVILLAVNLAGSQLL